MWGILIDDEEDVRLGLTEEPEHKPEEHHRGELHQEDYKRQLQRFVMAEIGLRRKRLPVPGTIGVWFCRCLERSA